MELAAIDAVAPKAVETGTLQPVEDEPAAPTPLARPKKLVEQKKAEPEKEKPREQPKKKPASNPYCMGPLVSPSISSTWF